MIRAFLRGLLCNCYGCSFMSLMMDVGLVLFVFGHFVWRLDLMFLVWAWVWLVYLFVVFSRVDVFV